MLPFDNLNLHHRAAPTINRRKNGSVIRDQPFSAESWLRRCTERRQQEFMARHAPTLRMGRGNAGLRSYEDYRSGVIAHRKGGPAWNVWSRASTPSTTSSRRSTANEGYTRARNGLLCAPPGQAFPLGRFPIRRAAPKLEEVDDFIKGWVPEEERAAQTLAARKAPVLQQGRSEAHKALYGKQFDSEPEQDGLRLTKAALNSRYSSMFKAFQHIDHDHSGTLDKEELTRALTEWNIPAYDENIQGLLAAADKDGSGGIDYKEFVAALARDTAIETVPLK